jgi:hypothetical protein
MNSLLEALRKSKMPEWNEREPDAHELARIQIAYDLDDERLEFSDLTKFEQDWLCRRFMPCIVRFGVYPPPNHKVDIPRHSSIHDIFAELKTKAITVKRLQPVLTLVK